MTERGQLRDLELNCAEKLKHLALALENGVAEGGNIVVIEFGHFAKSHWVSGIALLTCLG